MSCYECLRFQYWKENKMKITELELFKEIARNPEPLIVYGVLVCIIKEIIKRSEKNEIRRYKNGEASNRS